MGSKYPRSVRYCLPLWALMLEASFILTFAFFTSHDISPKDQKQFLGAYRDLQDYTIVAGLGFGFLTSSLRRHSWSSVAFNLFLLVLGVQWGLLMDKFLNWPFSEKMSLQLSSIRQATMSAVTVLISTGEVQGKANLVQLTVMTLLEVTAFGALKIAGWELFLLDTHHMDIMFFPVFGTYFGLIVAWLLSRPLSEGAEEKAQMATSPSLFGMLGTLFLWMFWPSFNSAGVNLPSEKRTAIYNTYYALAVSAVTATSMSALSHPQGKISMMHIHNAVLAGGVAVGAPCHMISSPWQAMVLGLTAGLITIGGAKYVGSFNHVLEIQDFSGAHYTFGLPGLLGVLSYTILLQFHESSMVGYQAFNIIGALGFAVVMSLASGLLTGLILKLKIWRAPHEAKHFDDQAFWEFPHLAVGF